MIVTVLIALLGWVAGALVNYLADVLPLRRKLSAPFCLRCEEQLNFFNYLLWPRRCPSCGKNRGWRSWVVELTAISVALWLWATPTTRLGFFPGLLLLIYFGVVVVIDIEYRLILHPVSLVGGLLGFIYGVRLHGISMTLLGGAVGFGMMLLLYFGGTVFMRILAKRRGQELDEEALGFGDVNLSGILGLLLGWPGIIAGLTLTILFGGAVSLIFLLLAIIRKRYRAFTAIPYGPFLIAGAFFLLYLR
jgi:prepilin signal peptidase PulO-like enzyme (type II secretory pathway)